MLFLKMLAEGLVKVVVKNLEIERVCRVNFGFSEQDCLYMDSGNRSHVQVSVTKALLKGSLSKN